MDTDLIPGTIRILEVHTTMDIILFITTAGMHRLLFSDQETDGTTTIIVGTVETTITTTTIPDMNITPIILIITIAHQDIHQITGLHKEEQITMPDHQEVTNRDELLLQEIHQGQKLPEVMINRITVFRWVKQGETALLLLTEAVTPQLTGVTVTPQLTGAATLQLTGVTVTLQLTGVTVTQQLTGVTVTQQLTVVTVTPQLTGAVKVTMKETLQHRGVIMYQSEGQQKYRVITPTEAAGVDIEAHRLPDPEM